MNITDIPLIIPNFNQLTYLRNLINWWQWYYPENPVIVVDNGSDYEPLLNWYGKLKYHSEGKIFKHFDDYEMPKLTVVRYPNNDIGNLKDYIENNKFNYYVISDPDIMPHPSTPPNFLEIFKGAIDSGFHHAGFDLITYDIPDWNKKAKWIQGDEAALKKQCIKLQYEGKEYTGHQAPIDTTFCLYTSKNGGWQAPMSGKDWDNSLRVLHAFHLPFYLSPDHLNDEMKHYYNTCLKRDDMKPSAGRNHFKPE